MSKIDDSQIVATFVALRAETGASADSVLVNPVLRARFLDIIRQQSGDIEEEPALKRLLNLRKQSRLPRG
jgi:hypothetical protein